MKGKKFLSILFVSGLTIGLAACGGNDDNSDADASDGDEEVTLEVAALESAYGSEVWDEIADAYEEANENVTIDLTVEKNLEEVLRPKMQAGDYPDVLLLATDREEALTETLIKDDGIEDISDVFEGDVYGEDEKVADKMQEGFTDTLATNPYGDDKTYMAPMFYSPAGLFYNKGLFDEKGWDVPDTWDDMWKLGDKAQEEDISLFTYPIAGYFDTFIGSMLFNAGGPDFFDSAMTYEDGIWETDEASEVFETTAKMKDYLHPDTVANANPEDFTKNQQLVLDNEALFMPDGDWVIDEMEEAPRADDFEWALTPPPAFDEDDDRYAFTFFEQMWIPKEADHIDAAKEFLSYMYSDEAADIFLDHGAVQPIEGMTDKLDDEQQEFYSIYDEGDVLPAMGTFASTDPVEGVDMGDTLYETIDSVMTGDKTWEEWQQEVEEASDKLRPAMK